MEELYSQYPILHILSFFLFLFFNNIVQTNESVRASDRKDLVMRVHLIKLTFSLAPLALKRFFPSSGG